jgi:hypothetical protein
MAAPTNVKNRIVARENNAMTLRAKIYLEFSKYFCLIMSVSPHGCAVAGTIMPGPMSSSSSIFLKIAFRHQSPSNVAVSNNIYHTPGIICPVVA